MKQEEPGPIYLASGVAAQALAALAEIWHRENPHPCPATKLEDVAEVYTILEAYREAAKRQLELLDPPVEGKPDA